MLGTPLKTVGLFAGIGGIEKGLSEAGHSSELLCEFDEAAQAVLNEHFPGVPVVGDVRDLAALPNGIDLLAAGFPCQDLSQAGRTAGITGERSGLVQEVFRLLDGMERAPTWVLFENVPFMLSLDRGEGMRWLTAQLESRGYRWAYRVVDTRAFGLPQRRKRVLLLASRVADPRTVLLADDHGEVVPISNVGLSSGFYWTEGLRGLGWAVDAIPTIKGGSTIGIPSPPAIWHHDTEWFGTPDLRDAERLQGFAADWTAPADEFGRRAMNRWKLVGNAVSVPVARWLGDQLAEPGEYCADRESELTSEARWPKAAWGESGVRVGVAVSDWPVHIPHEHLHDFLDHEQKPLSARASAGFLKRASESTLRFPEDFLESLEIHRQAQEDQLALAV